jgi:hypothetical protein
LGCTTQSVKYVAWAVETQEARRARTLRYTHRDEDDRAARLWRKVGDVGATGQTSESTSDQHAEDGQSYQLGVPPIELVTSTVPRKREITSAWTQCTARNTPTHVSKMRRSTIFFWFRWAALVVRDGQAVEAQWTPHRTRRR